MANAVNRTEVVEIAEQDAYVPVVEGCRILGVDATTVRLLAERGVLSSRKLPTLPLRISRRDCLKLAAESVRLATQGPAARAAVCA